MRLYNQRIVLNSISSSHSFQYSSRFAFIAWFMPKFSLNIFFHVRYPITMQTSWAMGIEESAENSSSMILRLETCRYYAIKSWHENSLYFSFYSHKHELEHTYEKKIFLLLVVGRQLWQKNNFIVMTSNLGISFSPLSKLFPISSFLLQIFSHFWKFSALLSRSRYGSKKNSEENKIKLLWVTR